MYPFARKDDREFLNPPLSLYPDKRVSFPIGTPSGNFARTESIAVSHLSVPGALGSGSDDAGIAVRDTTTRNGTSIADELFNFIISADKFFRLETACDNNWECSLIALVAVTAAE